MIKFAITGRSVVSLGTPVSSINKIDHHDITEILLKVSFTVITLILTSNKDCDIKYIPMFTTWVKRRVSHVAQELLTLTEHLISFPVCSGLGVAGSLIFRVVFCRSLLFILLFSLW